MGVSGAGGSYRRARKAKRISVEVLLGLSGGVASVREREVVVRGV